MTASITSDQIRQLVKLAKDAMNRVIEALRLDRSRAQRLLARGNEFIAAMVAKANELAGPDQRYDSARSILGEDLITPEEIAQARAIKYTGEQFGQFADTVPTEEQLLWCRDNGFMVVAGPPTELSLLEIRELKRGFFCSKFGGWYEGDRERFSREDKAAVAWLAIRKKAVPNSFSKSWNEQQELISDQEYIPNAAETVWAITVYRAVRGIYLLPNFYVHTLSLVSSGYRVHVGYFCVAGLCVVHHGLDGFCRGHLGVASARKFK
ncbi:MAG: hypothetical protein NTZ18_02455 [Candidatus Komeilibacteria bacterium]|nr:hypothetical protein [Candidatus Komeilibacteria bacterium]